MLHLHLQYLRKWLYVPPPPPSAPMPQKMLICILMILHSLLVHPKLLLLQHPSNSSFQSQHVVVEASDGSNIHKVSTFVKNESISNMLENGAIDNPVLKAAFEFVKKVSELELHLNFLCLKKIICFL